MFLWHSESLKTGEFKYTSHGFSIEKILVIQQRSFCLECGKENRKYWWEQGKNKGFEKSIHIVICYLNEQIIQSADNTQ